MTTLPPERSPAGGDDELVPIFGTWPRIYGAVVLNALIVMGLIALFSSWNY